MDTETLKYTLLQLQTSDWLIFVYCELRSSHLSASLGLCVKEAQWWLVWRGLQSSAFSSRVGTADIGAGYALFSDRMILMLFGAFPFCQLAKLNAKPPTSGRCYWDACFETGAQGTPEECVTYNMDLRKSRHSMIVYYCPCALVALGFRVSCLVGEIACYGYASLEANS